MKIKKLLILICSLILFSISNLFAQESETIFHQGILTDDTGEAVEDGSFIFTFRMYNEETGGESLWTENQVLQVNGGIFNAHLGSEENLNLAFDEKYWIGVAIDGGDELEPRMPLSAVPYAMHALSVKDGIITGAKLDPDVIQGGSNVSVERDQDTQNFIISADTPEGGLLSVHSDNSLLGDGTDESPLGLDYSEVVISEENLEAQSVTGDKIANDALQGGANVSVERDEDTQNFIISADTPEGGLLSVHSDNSLLGDGTDEDPLGLDYSELTISESNLEAGSVTGEKLDDNAILSGDNVTVNRDVDNNFVISADTPEESPWAINGSNISYLDGNVGIGTSTPESELDVNGDLITSGDLNTNGRLSVNQTNSPQTVAHIKQETYSSGLTLESNDAYTHGWTLLAYDLGDGDLQFRFSGDVYNESFAQRARISADDGSYIQVSDARLKINIQDIGQIIDDVLSLRPVDYQMIHAEQGEKRIKGFLAQEVKEIFPGMVSYDEREDQYGINYAQFGVIAIQAIQEQQEIIEAQQQELDRIKQVLREAGYNLD